MNYRLTLNAIAIVMTLPFAASAAMIEGHGDSVRLNTTAYDLDTAAGQESLYAEVIRAAESVCGTTKLRLAGSLDQAVKNRACVKDAVARAVEDLDNDGVRRIHEQS